MHGCIQMSMTCAHTVGAVRALLFEMGITAVAHHHQERDPAKHRDAYYWRVSRVADVVSLCRSVLPYAVTKKRHLELLLEFAEGRLGGQTIDAIGRISSRNRKPFTAGEWEIQQQISLLNARGPNTVAAL